MVLKAVSLGLPVVCLNFNDPDVIFNEKCNKKIITKDQYCQQIVIAMENELDNLIVGSEEYSILSSGAVSRIYGDFTV